MLVVVRQPEQATGSEAGRRHSWQEPKGRKDSRFRRDDCEPQLLRERARSWFVKKAIEASGFRADDEGIAIAHRVKYCACCATSSERMQGQSKMDDGK